MAPGSSFSERSGGSFFGTAAGNRAHDTSSCSTFTARFLFMQSSHKWNFKSHCKSITSREDNGTEKVGYVNFTNIIFDIERWFPEKPAKLNSDLFKL